MMQDEVEQYVLGLIQKKAKLPADVDLASFDYLASGHVDSLGVISFVAQLEQEYDITITNATMESAEFRTVGGVIGIILRLRAGGCRDGSKL